MSNNQEPLIDRREANSIILETLMRVDNKTDNLAEKMASMDSTMKSMVSDIDHLKTKGDDELKRIHDLENQVSLVQSTCNTLSDQMKVLGEVQTKILSHEKDLQDASKERTGINDSLAEIKKSISANDDRIKKVEDILKAMEARKKLLTWLANFGKPVIYAALGALFWIIIEYLQRPK